METLRRNKTMTFQVKSIEDSEAHPFRDGVHSARYFDLLKERRQLPASQARHNFLNTYQREQVIVMYGRHGVGKTTQIPQYVFFDEYASGLIVACTQPRKQTARSAAERVATEMDVYLGQEVGYADRVENLSSEKTRLMYMTDETLLHEAKSDNTFSSYSCVIVDGTKERSKSSEILLILLNNAIKRRSDLKVIIVCNRLASPNYRNLFGKGAFFEIPSVRHHVRVEYLPHRVNNYLDAALERITKVHNGTQDGDILVYLPCVKDVEKLCYKLRLETEDLSVLPLHSSLFKGEESRVFDKSNPFRKCIVAAEIDYTTLIFDNVAFVVDSGLTTRKDYMANFAMSQLDIGTISHAIAAERASRAGLTQPGTCFRLFREEDMTSGAIPKHNWSDIKMEELIPEILFLKSIGWDNMRKVPWMSPPFAANVARGLRDLYNMGYIHKNQSVTLDGIDALELPVHPIWYNAIVNAHELGCSLDMVFIAGLASTERPIFWSPYQKHLAARTAHAKFFHPLSDHLSRLQALKAYIALGQSDYSFSEQWCSANFLDHAMLDEALKISLRIVDIMMPLMGWDRLKVVTNRDLGGLDGQIRKALAQTFFFRAAIHANRGDDGYYTVHDHCLSLIHPLSALVCPRSEWIVYDRLHANYVDWTIPYIETVTAVDVSWLIDLPYFQNKRLSRDNNGDLKQPLVLQSLERARAERARALDQVSQSDICE